MGNSFGHLFKVTTWGESHGPALGVVIEGCPPGLKIDVKKIQKELNRRRPGQSQWATQRQEADQVELLSGIFEGRSIGTPISLIIYNKDQRSKDYELLKEVFRPSHADFTYEAKYGHVDWRGGGRASARETAARVTAGAVAKQVLAALTPLKIMAYVSQIYDVQANINSKRLTSAWIEKSPLRCPDPQAEKKMLHLIERAQAEGDSVGGVIECLVQGVPAGLGSPVFEKLEARLAQAMLSLPACRGFEIGEGFESTRKKGSENNDVLIRQNDQIKTLTNHAGGIVGGISNGMPIHFKVAFKPPASILKTQQTLNKKGQTVSLSVQGRHDACILPRAVPIVEAMTALVLLDEWLLQRSLGLS